MCAGRKQSTFLELCCFPMTTSPWMCFLQGQRLSGISCRLETQLRLVITCVHAHRDIHICINTHLNTHTYMHTYIHTFIHMHRHMPCLFQNLSRHWPWLWPIETWMESTLTPFSVVRLLGFESWALKNREMQSQPAGETLVTLR